MSFRKLEVQQWLPTDITTAWDFFSSPYNLNRITPPDMSFEILSDVEDKKMYAGMLIAYRVRPLLNIPMSWLTEITQVSDRKYFVDEQRVGPYAMWHHEHHFEEKDGGVLMTDILHYRVPFGFLGVLADRLLVYRRVNEIFNFRKLILREIFPAS
jgi:ligand-binding SRPBCC domain-containing protein